MVRKTTSAARSPNATSAAEPTATSVATAATHFSGSLRPAGSSASRFGIILAPGSASAAGLPSRSFQTSSAAADSPPDVAAARGYAPITETSDKWLTRHQDCRQGREPRGCATLIFNLPPDFETPMKVEDKPLTMPRQERRRRSGKLKMIFGPVFLWIPEAIGRPGATARKPPVFRAHRPATQPTPRAFR